MKVVWLTPERMDLAPDSAVIWRSNPWFVPDDGKDWRVSLAVGCVVSRLGKHIAPKFARRYYDGIVVCAHPWAALSSAPSNDWWRDGAIVAGRTFECAGLPDEVVVTVSDGSQVFFNLDHLYEQLDLAVVRASRLATIKTGDILAVQLPGDPIPVTEGTDFTVHVDTERALLFKTR